MDEDADEAACETVDYVDENEGNLNFGDADQSEWMQASIDGALMPADFGVADVTDDPINNLVDPALGSTPAQVLLVTDDNNDAEVLIQRPSLSSSTLAGRHLSISIGSKYVSEYFRNAHPMWPFLHKTQWDDCWRHWESPVGGHTRAAWMYFFADMVCNMAPMCDTF